MLKKYFYLIVAGLVLAVSPTYADDCQDGDYVLSAYYSPLPGQNHYATGTYASDIVLNGGGIITASGEYVSDIPYAFVAAPGCFEFGDILQVQDLGYFKVLDRGGAIKGNRLDVWVGSGNSGLTTALNFGKKTLFVKKVSGISDEDLVNSYKILDQQLLNLPKNGIYNPLEFMHNLSLGDEGYFVSIVQQLLKDVGLYSQEITSVFDNNTQEALDYFINNISKFKTDNLPSTGLNLILFDNLKSFALHKRQEELEYDFLFSSLSIGMENLDVLNLQKFLYLLGYSLETTGKFDIATKKALEKFQIKNNISLNNSNSNGEFGPKTKRVLFQKLLENDFSREGFDLDSFFYEPVYKDQSSALVNSLQNFLKSAGFYKASITGVMDPLTINALKHFQLSSKVIVSSDDTGAGFFGPKTRRMANDILLRSNSFLAKYTKSLNDVTSTSAVVVDELEQSESEPVASNGVVKSSVEENILGLKYQDKGEAVETLQSLLIASGYLKARYTTNYFGDKTNQALDLLKLDLKNDFGVDSKSGVVDMSTFRFLTDN